MNWTSGGCESESGGTRPLGNMPLRLLERAAVAALDHLETAEEYLATCDLAVFASPVERALL